MKKMLVFAMAGMLTFGTPVLSVSASSLDELVSQNEESTDTPVQQAPEQGSDPAQEQTAQPVQQSSGQQTNRESADEYMEQIKSATDLTEVSPGATKINEGIKKVASFIIQVLAYFITAFLAVKVLIDLCYITIPFTRTFLGNGYQGDPSMAQGGMGGMGMNGMGGMGMGGMGMNRGMGMGGMGMGGYGMNRMGMGGMGGMGMGGMGMNGMQGGMQGGMGQAMGKIQWVSNAALNAVMSPSPLKFYAKDMTAVLIVTPILIVLAVTGVLTDLGFLLGDLIAQAVGGIGNML